MVAPFRTQSLGILPALHALSSSDGLSDMRLRVDNLGIPNIVARIVLLAS
jgi:hypothetical protein